MAKVGWYGHIVENADGPTGFNCHTHGLAVDFQIVFPVSHYVADSVLTTMADRSKGGEKFIDGQEIHGVIRNYPIKLALATESGREVLRIILPDRHGKFGKEAEGAFPLQYVGTKGGA